MRTALFAISLCFLTALHTQAQSTEKRTKIRQLLTLMKADSMALKQMDVSIGNYKQMTAMMLEQNKIRLDSGLVAQQDEFLKKVIAKTKENTLKLINEDMVEVYDQHFTADDIQALSNFYATPIGRKMINLAPIISKDLMTRSMTKYQPEIAKMVQTYIETMRGNANR